MKNKKTAVEFLIEHIKLDAMFKAKSIDEWVNIFQQAKAMEREQMEISFCKGYDRCEWENSIGSYYEEEPSDFDNYYNETYKGGEQ